jgi:hypothetical protein
MRMRAGCDWVALWGLVILGSVVLSVPGPLAAQTLNLYRGELNGAPFYALTPEALLRLLGPPTTPEPVTGVPGTDVHLQYPEHGLAFWLHAGNANTPPTCWKMVIYMVPVQEAPSARPVRPFHGQISKNLRHTWAPSRLEEEFRAFAPRRLTPGERHSVLTPAGSPGDAGSERSEVLAIEWETFTVYFLYQKASALLEQIHLTRPQKVRSERRDTR